MAEVISVATMRSLPSLHPIYKVFKGTCPCASAVHSSHIPPQEATPQGLLCSILGEAAILVSVWVHEHTHTHAHRSSTMEILKMCSCYELGKK